MYFVHFIRLTKFQRYFFEILPKMKLSTPEFFTVIAVDIDPLKLRCALQNARVYGVSSRINFICANFFHVADSMFGIRIDKDSGQVVESERKWVFIFYFFVIMNYNQKIF